MSGRHHRAERSLDGEHHTTHRSGPDELVRSHLGPALAAEGWMEPGELAVLFALAAAEAVWADFWAWRPHLAPGAVVVFDDVDFPDVATVTDSLVALEALTPQGRAGKVAWFEVAAPHPHETTEAQTTGPAAASATTPSAGGAPGDARAGAAGPTSAGRTCSR